MSTAEAMAHIVIAYYPTLKLPDGAYAVGLYQSVLHKQRVLILYVITRVVVNKLSRFYLLHPAS